MGGSPSIPPPPAAPNPYETSNAQSAANRDTAITTALLNFIDEKTPLGSSVYNMTGYYAMPNSLDSEGNQVSGAGVPRFVPFGEDGAGPVWMPGSGGPGGGGAAPSGYAGLGYKTVDPSEVPNAAAGMEYVISPETGMVHAVPTGLGNEQVKAHIAARDQGAPGPWNIDTTVGGPRRQPYTMGAGTGGGGGAGGYWSGMGGGLPPGYFAVPKFQREVTLSPDQQAILDENERLQLQLLGFGNEQAGRLREHLSSPVSFDAAHQLPGGDYETSRRRVEEALMSRIQPQYERDRASLDATLASRGVLPGTEAYNREADEINRALTDARMQTVLAGGQEQSRLFGLDMSQRQQDISEILALRNQPINEIGAILSMGQVQMPQFAPPPSIPVAGTNLEGNVYQGYQGQISGYNSQLQAQQAAERSRAGTLGSVFGTIGKLGGGLLALSDRRAKTAVRKLAELANGFALYAFRYIGDATERVGYMADEVRKVSPWAVVEIGELDHVDYDAVRI